MRYSKCVYTLEQRMEKKTFSIYSQCLSAFFKFPIFGKKKIFCLPFAIFWSKNEKKNFNSDGIENITFEKAQIKLKQYNK